MPIDTEHPQYLQRKPQWERCRDAIAGQETVHACGEKYLPMLSGQNTDEYNAYKNRALFHGATSRTLDALSGMVFRKEPQIEVPSAMNDFMEDVTLDGMSFRGFAEDVVDHDIAVGRGGIMIDHPEAIQLEEGGQVTIAQAEAMNMRPFLKLYNAESIFNWRTASRNNAMILTEVRLWETVVEDDPLNEFEVDEHEQIRVLDFNEAGQYRQRVFRKATGGENNSKEWIQFGPDVIPLLRGQPMDFIPFIFFGVKNSGPDAEKPPLIDLANANFSHYTSTADLEHGAHFTALPTAVITGFNDEENNPSFRIGSASAWVFPDPDADAKYLEFEGQGLEALEKRVQKKEEYMATLGARMLAPEKRQVETAEVAGIHRMGENSVLASLAGSVDNSLEQALIIAAEWMGVQNPDVTVMLNKDFIAVKMAPEELKAQMLAWQSGAIAFADLLHNLKRGEIVQDDRTEDEIRSEVEVSNPFDQQDLPPDDDTD